MIALSVELSSPRGSVALWKDGALFSADCLEIGSSSGGRALAAIRSLCERESCELNQVDLFVAGRGPGNYSGIRMALILAQTLALPRGRETMAVDSGAALADDILTETGARRVAIAGDARRDQVWVGIFEQTDPFRTPVGGWQLHSPDVLQQTALADRFATSEWNRIAPMMDMDAPGHWITESRYPSAAALLKIALRRREAGLASDPYEPLYLHPAVRG